MKLLLVHPVIVLAAVVFVGCTACSWAQVAPAAPSPVPVPSRVEGTDADSGTHYVRLSVLSSVPTVPADLAARFTLECRDVKGKHDMLWFLSFGGVPTQNFVPPFKPSQADPFPPNYQKVKLKMDFEGYMRSKPFTRSWEELPSGEFRYCNAGLQCPNMETARFYMSYLNALPTLRIAYAKSLDSSPPPEQVFQLRNLVDEANKTPVCVP
ncbi:MAG TPA: hypothetical protein VL986_01315 [Terracidiphilus sp.]|nr:hypothetical protein [Terracidiphilus sp.]